LREVFGAYLDQYAKPRKRSWREDERMYNTYLAPLHARRIGSIVRSDVTAIHNRTGKDAPYQANRVLALLSTLYGFADAQGWTVPNPCRGVKRFPEQSRDRFADADELRRLFEAIADEGDGRVRVAVLLALLTGARKKNVLGMRWLNLDLDRGLWRIPEAEAKGGYALVVVLPSEAVALLRQHRTDANGSAYVFPGRGGKGCLHDIRKPWAAIRERAGLSDIRLHDLRRTLGSWMAAQGASLPIIGKALGHRHVGTTAIYARLDVDPVRRSVEAAATAMMAAANGKPKGKGAVDGNS
jgi:integrase